MGLRSLFENNGAFFARKEHPAKWYHDKVNSDINVHTTRPNTDKGEKNEILHEVRPNELEKVKDYRVTADKQITGGAVREFISKCNRIIRQSNISLSSLSPQTSEWVDSRPFIDNHQSLDLDTYTIDVILRQAIAHSPNDVLVAFPVNGNNPELPPSELELNESPLPKPLLIPFKDLRDGKGYLMFTIGNIEVKKDKGFSEEELLFGADEDWWYMFEPFYEKEGSQSVLKYRIIEWFFHNTGESLMNFLPGERARSKDGTITYQETHIKSYYDLAFFASNAFSDDFIVRLNHSHPITKMNPPDCKACSGTGFNGGVRSKGKCGECDGVGKVLALSPGEFYIGSEDAEVGGDGKSKRLPLVEYYNPDIGYAKHSFETMFKLLQEAKQSIGLDLLNGTSVESGKAKDLRLESLQDKLSKIASNLFECRDRLLWQVECLLVPNEEDRVRPVTMIPQKLSVKDLATLKEEAKTALPENRVVAHREYFSCKYQNDPLEIRKHSLMIDYCPLYVLTDNEINILLAKNICKDNDMIRKLYANQAIEAVMEDVDILNIENLEIFELMDAYLEGRDLLVDENEIPIIPLVGGESVGASSDETAEPEFAPSAGNKLAQSVGGSQIIRDLNNDIADGNLTRELGLNAAMIQLGYSRDEANRLIVDPSDLPEPEIISPT